MTSKENLYAPQQYPGVTPTGAAFCALIEPVVGRKSVILGYHASVRLAGHIHAVGKLPVPDGGDPVTVKAAILGMAADKAAAVDGAPAPTLDLEDWK